MPPRALHVQEHGGWVSHIRQLVVNRFDSRLVDAAPRGGRCSGEEELVPGQAGEGKLGRGQDWRKLPAVSQNIIADVKHPDIGQRCEVDSGNPILLQMQLYQIGKLYIDNYMI